MTKNQRRDGGVRPQKSSPWFRQRSVAVFAGAFFALGISSARAAKTKLVDCSSAAGSLVVNFVTDYGKADWAKTSVEAFNGSAPRLGTGDGAKPICVQLFIDGSAELLIEALETDAGRGAELAHIVSPSSDLFFGRYNALNRARRGSDLIRQADSLAVSPIVIAAWAPTAEKLGGRATPPSWRKLAEAIQDDRSIKAKLASPARDDAGLSALLGFFYAAEETRVGYPTRVLSQAHVADRANLTFVSSVLASLSSGASSTGTLVHGMLEDGPAFADVIVAHESDVIYVNYRLKNDLAAKGFPKLEGLYPADGTFTANHPIGFVEREWLTDDARAAADEFRIFLLAEAQQNDLFRTGLRAGGEANLGSLVGRINSRWTPDYGTAGFGRRLNFKQRPTVEAIADALTGFGQMRLGASR